MTAPDVVVTVTLNPEQALALAQFVKRLCWSDMRGCAVDDDECYVIRDAVELLRRGLADQGYAPR